MEIGRLWWLNMGGRELRMPCDSVCIDWGKGSLIKTGNTLGQERFQAKVIRHIR